MDHSSMNHAGMEHSQMNMSDDMATSEVIVSSASVNGIVNSVMVGHRMVNISRGPIEKWGREAADVDFIVAENVDMTLFAESTNLNFTFEIKDGEFLIIEAKLAEIIVIDAMTSEATTKGAL